MNTLVAGYRKFYPEDTRSDEAITLDLGEKYPEALPRFPDAAEEYNRLKTSLAADQPEPSSFGGAVARGAARGIIPAGAAALGGLAAAAAVPPSAPFIVPLVAGFLGAGAAGLGGAKVEQAVEQNLPTAAKARLQADVEQQPLASEIGNIASSLPFFEFAPGKTVQGGWAIAKLLAGQTLTDAEKLIARDAAIQMGLGTAQGAAIPLVFEGRTPTQQELAMAAVQAALFGGAHKYLPFSHPATGVKARTEGGPSTSDQQKGGEPAIAGEAGGSPAPSSTSAEPPGVATATELAGNRRQDNQDAIRRVIARELTGERSQSLEEAINAILASSDAGFYTLEKARLSKLYNEFNPSEPKEENASSQPSATGVPEPEVRAPVGETPPLRQSGEVTPAREPTDEQPAPAGEPEGAPVLHPPEGEVKPGLSAEEQAALLADVEHGNVEGVTAETEDNTKEGAKQKVEGYLEYAKEAGIDEPQWSKKEVSDAIDKIEAAHIASGSKTLPFDAYGLTKQQIGVLRRAGVLDAQLNAPPFQVVPHWRVAFENRYRANAAIDVNDIETALANKQPVKPPAPNATVTVTEGGQTPVQQVVHPKPAPVRRTYLETRKVNKSEWEAMPIVSEPTETHGRIRADESGGQWENIGGIKRLTIGKLAQPVEGVQNKQTISATPEVKQVKHVSPGELINMVDFVKSKVAGEGVPTKKGQKNAEGFTETSESGELYKDIRAGGSKNNSKKLGVFVKPNGEVVIGTAFENPNRFISTPEGRSKFQELLDAGWKLVASIKTKEPTNGFSARYTAEEWNNQILPELRQKRASVREGGIAEVAPESLGHVGEGGEIEGAKGVTITEGGESKVVEEKDRLNRISKPDAETLHKNIGDLKGLSAEEAANKISDGLILNPALLKKLVSLDSPNAAHLLQRLIDHIHDSYEAGKGEKDKVVEQLQRVFGQSEGAGGRAKPAPEGAQPLRNPAQPANNPGAANPERAGGATAAGGQPGSGAIEIGDTVRVKNARGGGQFAGKVVEVNGNNLVVRASNGTEFENYTVEPSRIVSVTKPEPTGGRPTAADIVRAAASQTETNPSPGKAAAGNYAKGHVKIDGMEIAIETGKGEVRRATDGSWEVTMPADYGQILGTKGADGDPIDVFIGPKPDNGLVWVIDQKDPATGKFDEHKVMLGFESREQAMAAYLAAFSDNSGPKRLGEITQMTPADLAKWLKSGNTKGSIAYGKEFTTKAVNQAGGERRFRSDIDREHWMERARYSAQGFREALENLAASGLSTDLVIQRAGEALKELNHYDNARQLIHLTIAALHNPSVDNFAALVHEAGHALFQNETPERQRALENAIKSVSDRTLNIEGFATSIVEGKTPEQIAQITHEERFVEAVGRKLAQEGWRPDEAKGAIQGIIRFVKDLMFRAAMWFQESRFGGGALRPELARKYFENRMQALLAGDSSMSFLNSIGGRKLTFREQLAEHPSVDGAGMPSGRYDFATDRVLHPEPLPTNGETIRFRAQQYANDPNTQLATDIDSTALAHRDVAAYNSIEQGLRGMYDAWVAAGHNLGGLSFDDFVRSNKYVTAADLPKDMVAARNAELAKLGQAPVRPDTRIVDLPTETLRQRAATVAQGELYGMRKTMDIRRSEAGHNLSPTNRHNLVDRLARLNTRLMNIHAKATNAEFIRNDALNEIGRLWKEMRDGLTNLKNKGKRSGMIVQTLNGIEGQMDEPVMRQYAGAINKLYTKLSGNTSAADHFVDTLQKVAEISGIDWKNDSAAEIARKIRAAVPGTPELQSLVHPDVDSRALMAVAVTFGKENESVMLNLLLRRSDALAERATINAALNKAMSDSRNAISDARIMVKRLPRLSVIADRLISKLEATKEEHQHLLDEIKREREFVDFHQAAIPYLREHLANLESMNGTAVAMFDPKDGASYAVPRSPNAKFDLTWQKASDGSDILAPTTNEATPKELSLKAGGHVRAEILDDMKSIRAWLDAQPADQHGATWNYLNQVHEKLGWLDKNWDHQVKQSNVVTRIFGTIIDKLRMVGHPAATEAARKLEKINYNFENYAKHPDLIRLTSKWERAESDAMKRTGWRGGLEAWRQLFHDRMMKYFEDRQDIWAKDQPDVALTKALAAGKVYMERDPDTASYVNKPGAWAALERYYRAATAVADWHNKSVRNMGNMVQDSGRGYDFFRNTIGVAPMTTRRLWSDLSARVYRGMLDDWVGVKSPVLTAEEVAQAHRTDPLALRNALQSRFTPQVWRDFVKPLAYRAARSLFNAPVRNDGYVPLAMREKVIKAFDAAPPGDAVSFAENLFRLEHGTGDVSDFVGETLETLQNWFDVLHNEHADTNDATGRGMPIPKRALMDARRSDEAPAEWLQYQRYDTQSMRQAIKSAAYHAGGGRNLEALYSNFDTAIRELGNLASDYRQLVQDVRASTPATGRKLREALKAEATRRGQDLTVLENAARNQSQAASMKRAFEGIVRSQLDIPLELRPFMEIIHAMASLAVQGPGTALTDTASLGMQPLRHMGLTKEAARDILQHYKVLAENVFGSLGYAFNKQLNLDTEANNRMHRLGFVDSDGVVRIKDKVLGLTHEPIQGLPEAEGRGILARAGIGLARGAVLASRVARLIPGTGIGRADETRFNYPTLKPLGVFSQSAQSQHAAVVKTSWTRTENLLGKMVEFYESHPTEAADNNFNLSAKQLGYSERGFDYIKSSLQHAGIDIEHQARSVMEARKRNPDAPIMSDQQYRDVGVQAVNEVMLESNFATRPPSFTSNPWLAASTPLVGWGISSMNDAAKAFAEPSGKASWKGLKGGIAAYAAILPLGLAYAWLRDEYDENVQGKKANVQGFGENNNFLAAIDKLGRSGVLFGTAGDAINAMFNQDTNRPFSVDSRVLFVSSMLNALNAVGTAIRQGSADYQSVYRPLMTALGGNGYLQYADTLNHAMSLDNAEARVTARISVGNYLRAAGREMNLDVRTGRAMGSLPTPMKPYISQMVLAAYANDHEAFREAYHNAVAEAREAKKPDPAKAVAEAYSAYHPLKTVFRVEPTPEEYHKALSIMDDAGRTAVSQAVRLFNSYAEQIGAKGNEGRRVKQAPAYQPVNLSDLRARAAAF